VKLQWNYNEITVPGKSSNRNKQRKLKEQIKTSPKYGRKEQGISMSEPLIFYTQVSMCVFVFVCVCVYVCLYVHYFTADNILTSEFPLHVLE